MQRDPKFVRDILQYIADNTPPNEARIELPLTIPGYQYLESPESIYDGHRAETDFLTDLCLEAGFFKTTSENGAMHIRRLTWHGYEMLDRLNRLQ